MKTGKIFWLPLTIMLAWLCTLQVQAQTTYNLTVIDSASRDAVAFAGIVNLKNQLVATTDLDGKAKLTAMPGTVYVLKSTSYKPTRFTLGKSTDMVVMMPPDAFKLEDVVILPGENPAHRLIWEAVKNRDKNNPQKSCKHCYNAYNKLVFKPDEDSLQKESGKHTPEDTSFTEMMRFFNRQHLFITESLTERYFNPPAKSSEKIIANRVSGFANPLFSILATELQSFGYYYDDIKLLGVKYLNPISPGSTDRYRFKLIDTTYENNDTIYTITFEPRKGKSFKGLKGELAVHTRGYAIKSIKAQPVSSEGFRIFINQLYGIIEDKQWFPLQLNAKMYLPENMSVNGLVLHGDNKGYLTNIRLGDACETKKTDEIALEIVSTTRDTSASRLQKFNPTELDEREKNTYQKIDSLGDKHNFDARLNRITQLFAGKIPVGPINIDLNRVLGYNHHEGIRLGLGLSTNYKVSRRHSLSAYGAYGFKDKVFKYGGDLRLLFYPRKQTAFTIGYRSDVFEAAGPANFYEETIFLSAANARSLYLRKFDQHEQWEATLSSRLFRHFHVRGFANVQYRKPLYDYEFIEPAGDNSQFIPTSYHVTETGAVVRFAFREKFVLADNKLISQGTPFPVLTAKYTRSIDGVFLNDFDYSRIDIKLEKNMKIRNFGLFSVSAQAGKIYGNVPYTFLTSFTASQARYEISVPQSLEGMRLNEFMADEYAMLFLSHNFLANLFYNTKNKPQLELFTNMAWGRLNPANAARHNLIEVKTPEKGYYESGIRIHSLLRLGFTRLGIALGYRYGPYAMNKFIDNAVIKFTTGFVLD